MPTTVVLGSGIIGLSTAYYLSQLTQITPTSDPDNTPTHHIHIIEPAPMLFTSASGRAAGFLAKDWFGQAVTPLGSLSFELHKQLAEEHNGRARWGWSESVSYSLDRDSDSVLSVGDTESEQNATWQGEMQNEQMLAAANGLEGSANGLDWLRSGASRVTERTAEQPLSSSKTHPRHDPEWPAWLRTRPDALQAISEKHTTGQVIPRQLCEFLLEACLARGVTLHQPVRATKLMRAHPADPTSRTTLRLQRLDGSASGGSDTFDLQCDNLVIAAGCWTPEVYKTLFPNAGRIPRVTPLAGHSVVLRSKHWSRASSAAAASCCHAVFTSDPAGFSPEIFSRTSGDIWVGGLNSSVLALPALPTDVVPQPESINTLLNTAKKLCGDIEVISEGLCFRPVSATGRPILAKVHEADLGDGQKVGGAVVVASGHGPWGISLGPGTGMIVSELVLGREPSADISELARW